MAADTFTALIGDYVNNAKEEVENTHQWNSRVFAPTFDGTAGIRTYVIASPLALIGGAYTNERSEIVLEPETGLALVYDITDSTAPLRMREVSEAHRTALQRSLPATTDIPRIFSLTNNGTSLTMNLLELPSSVRRYEVRVYIPQEELVNAVDILMIPWRPVVLLAAIHAYRERGEELGPMPDSLMSEYTKALGDARLVDIQPGYLELRPD